MHQSHKSIILPPPYHNLIRSDPSTLQSPLTSFTDVKTPLDTPVCSADNRHHPSFVVGRFASRCLPVTPCYTVPRSYGPTEFGSLPCGGDLTGIRHVSGEAKGKRSLGDGGAGVAESGNREEFELFVS